MLFEQLPSPLDRLVKEDHTSVSIDKGETLFFQGSDTTGLYYLVSGAIDLSRTMETGHCVLIHHARPKDTFAEASLFSDYYHCTATVVQKSQLILCKRTAIIKLFDTDIDFARAMASRFAAQLQLSRRRVELLSIRSAAERILAALNDGLMLDDISSFADVIGLAPETVYRNLAQLSEDGKLVKTARGQYRAREE